MDHNRRRSNSAFVLLLLAGLASAPSLASEQESLFAALGVRAGLRVADVGAGDGAWAERLAREVGESGHVFATEVDPAELAKIEKRVQDAGLTNVTAVKGTQHETGLSAGCCDAILLRMVYHHFAEPARMRASLKEALRPGALLVIIDTEPQKDWRRLEGVPERGGHGIREEDLVREMTGDGFEVAARHAAWNGDVNRYCVVFRRASRSAARSSSGSRALTGVVRLQEGTSPHSVVTVGAEVTLDVSLRGPLPAEPLAWTLLLAGVEQATGDVGRVAGGVPVREFEVVTLIEYEDFALATRETRAPSGPGPTGTPLVRDLRYEVRVSGRESGAVVAKAAGVVKATCDAEDRHPVCWPEKKLDPKPPVRP